MKNFETLQINAFEQLKNQIAFLKDLALDAGSTDEDRDVAYYEACGFAWAFHKIGLISWNDASVYVRKFAAAIEGSLGNE